MHCVCQQRRSNQSQNILYNYISRIDGTNKNDTPRRCSPSPAFTCGFAEVLHPRRRARRSAASADEPKIGPQKTEQNKSETPPRQRRIPGFSRGNPRSVLFLAVPQNAPNSASKINFAAAADVRLFRGARRARTVQFVFNAIGGGLNENGDVTLTEL